MAHLVQKFSWIYRNSVGYVEILLDTEILFVTEILLNTEILLHNRNSLA